MPMRLIAAAVAATSATVAGIYISGDPTPREQAVAAINALSARAALSGRVAITNENAAPFADQSMEFDKGVLFAAASNDGRSPFLALTDGVNTALRVTSVGAPGDPSPAVAHAAHLLDLARLAKAAAKAEWTSDTNGTVLRARLDPAAFADLVAPAVLALPSLEGQQLPDFIKNALGKPEVKHINVRLVLAAGTPTEITFGVVRTLPPFIAQALGGGGGGKGGSSPVQISFGGDAAEKPESVEWVTKAVFTFSEKGAESTAEARRVLAERLAVAQGETASAPAAPVTQPAPSTEPVKPSSQTVPAGAGKSAQSVVSKLMRESDHDGDGKLSQAELGEKKFASLAPFDTDHNGLIDESELAKALQAAVKQKREAAAK